MGKKVIIHPRAAFELQGEDTTYRGRFSLYAIDVFLQTMGIDNYIDFMNRLSVGMSLREYASLLAAALNDYDREEAKYTRAMALDIMDEVFGGVVDQELVELFMIAIGKIADTKSLELEVKGGEDVEKKSNNYVSSTTGYNSESLPTAQA